MYYICIVILHQQNLIINVHGLSVVIQADHKFLNWGTFWGTFETIKRNNPLIINLINQKVVLETGIEPVRTLLPTGF